MVLCPCFRQCARFGAALKESGSEAGRNKPVEKKKPISLITLFWGVFTVSAFTFGGGFVIVTFLKKKFVDELGWIDEAEMLDYIALAQSTPGSIAVNAAILLGWNTMGFPGMLTGVLAAVLPPMIILGVISLFYAAFASNRAVSLVLKGMQAGVAAVIIDTVLTLGQNVIKEKSSLHIILMLAAFCAAFFFRVNVILLIGAALVFGLGEAFFTRNKQRGGEKA